MERRKPLQRKTPLKKESGKVRRIKWDADGMCRHGRRRGDCRSCISTRNRNFGRAVQREMHQLLGGTGVSPTHEETGRGYDVTFGVGRDEDTHEGVIDVPDVATIKVHPEAKAGEQIPASLVKFLGTDWYRRALGQSQRSLPIGSGARPAVWCHLPGGRKVLIVDFGGGHG